MPFLNDLLDGVPHSAPGGLLSPAQIKENISSVHGQYKEARGRGVHVLGGKPAFVFAMCSMRVAKYLRILNTPEALRCVKYFLRVAAQKLDELESAFSALKPRVAALDHVKKQRAYANRVRLTCVAGAIDILGTLDPSARNKPGFRERAKRFLLEDVSGGFSEVGSTVEGILAGGIN